MKTKSAIIAFATAAVIAGFAATNVAAEENDETITMDQVPQVVKDTLKKYAAESEVKKIEKGSDDGTKVFEFDIEKSGKKFEVAITPKGKFWGQEEDMALSAMPDAAQKAIQTEAGGGKISGGEKAVDRHQKVTYEANIEKDGKKYEIAVDDNGKVISKESASDEKKAEAKEGKEEKDEKN